MAGGRLTTVAEPRRYTLNPRRAYQVVDDFEQELAHYTGAPYAVTVDSCTNALMLALRHERQTRRSLGSRILQLPKHTYVGVLQAAANAGYTWQLTDHDWEGDYPLWPTCVIDSARRIARGMYERDTLTCLSFDHGKQLALGHGGAILTGDADAAAWLRRARADGRAPGNPEPYATTPGWHCPLDPPTAALGLWILSRWTDTNYEPVSLPADAYPDLSQHGF